MFKRFLAVALGLILAVTCFGCDEPASGAELTVTVVVAGGLGDRSFYDSANDGLQRLMEDYGVNGNVIECKEDASMYQLQLVQAAEQSDFVIAVGWQFWDALNEVAPMMPEVKFIYVDEAVEGIDNIFNIKYAQNEGSFLVGYVAGKMTQTGKVGAVGGMDGDTINDFIVGYKQGAEHANPDVEVLWNYAGTYEDPAKGKECALALYDQGCDIVFQIAGKTGDGVFNAAAETHNFAIGVDSDQKYINPDVIICSMIKQVGSSIYQTIANYIEDGTWAGGTIWTANMETGLVGIGYGDDTMTQQVSDELKAEIEDIMAKIVSGEIVVDTTRN
ncbi:MAG: BMP family ABC transporter substrate-binding protein [Clostridia bacterium]|nr:BMP family ABC transporter substrate-binding protein [Clostridia bacterium]